MDTEAYVEIQADCVVKTYALAEAAARGQKSSPTHSRNDQ